MPSLEPVILLHSSGASGAQWRALAARLAGRYQVFTPDFRGYGSAAPWTGHGAFSLAQEAGVVESILEGIGEPAHLVGHSYGGAVALHFARLNGARLRSLTLIEPVAFHLLEGRVEVAALANRVVRAVACGDFHGGMRSFVDYWSGAGSWDAIPEAKRKAMALCLPKIALEFHAAISEPAGLHDFARLAVPTLLLRGELSPRPTRRICELLAQVLPSSELVTIGGAGHMAPLTHAGAINERIAAHLEPQRVVPFRNPARERRFAIQ